MADAATKESREAKQSVVEEGEKPSYYPEGDPASTTTPDWITIGPHPSPASSTSIGHFTEDGRWYYGPANDRED